MLKVIGAGFGRTGTLSLKTALEELGFGPCYHMFEVGKTPGHRKVWAAAARGETVDWEEIYGNYQATVDWPGCTYYKELMEAYPDAKVLLNIRDPEKWYESALNSIYYTTKSAQQLAALTSQGTPPSAQPLTTATERIVQEKVGSRSIWEGTFHGRFDDRRHAIEVFNQHNEEVKRYVPADRLLVYEVKDGWEPLCEFLNVEVPSGKPFPRLNDRATFSETIRSSSTKSWSRMLEEYRKAYVAVKDQWGLAALESVPAPEDFSSMVQDLQTLAQEVDRLQADARFAEARSCLEKVGARGRSLMNAQAVLGAAVMEADSKERGAEEELHYR